MNKADALKYKALKKALDAGSAKLILDCHRLCKQNSPVYNPWEVLLPILAPLMIGLILIMSASVVFGLIFICLMIFLFNTFLKKYLYVRIIKRTKDFIASSYDNCQKIWEYGGIVLVNAKDQKIGCVSPDGNWKDFVTLNFAEFMAEKKVEDKVVEEPKPVEQQPTNRRTIERRAIERKPIERKPIERRPIERRPIERNANPQQNQETNSENASRLERPARPERPERPARPDRPVVERKPRERTPIVQKTK